MMPSLLGHYMDPDTVGIAQLAHGLPSFSFNWPIGQCFLVRQRDGFDLS